MAGRHSHVQAICMRSRSAISNEGHRPLDSWPNGNWRWPSAGQGVQHSSDGRSEFDFCLEQNRPSTTGSVRSRPFSDGRWPVSFCYFYLTNLDKVGIVMSCEAEPPVPSLADLC